MQQTDGYYYTNAKENMECKISFTKFYCIYQILISLAVYVCNNNYTKLVPHFKHFKSTNYNLKHTLFNANTPLPYIALKLSPQIRKRQIKPADPGSAGSS